MGAQDDLELMEGRTKEHNENLRVCLDEELGGKGRAFLFSKLRKL